MLVHRKRNHHWHVLSIRFQSLEEAFRDDEEFFLKRSSWNARVQRWVYWTGHRGQQATWGCFGSSVQGHTKTRVNTEEAPANTGNGVLEKGKK